MSRNGSSTCHERIHLNAANSRNESFTHHELGHQNAANTHTHIWHTHTHMCGTNRIHICQAQMARMGKSHRNVKNWVIYGSRTGQSKQRDLHAYVRHKINTYMWGTNGQELFKCRELSHLRVTNWAIETTRGTKSTHICEAPMGKSYLNVTNWVIYASRTGSFKRRELTSICAARVQHTYRRHEWAIVTYLLRTESFMRHELGHLNAANSHAYVRHELNTHMRGTNGQ